MGEEVNDARILTAHPSSSTFTNLKSPIQDFVNYGVILDGCSMKNHCLTKNCLHGAKCTSNWYIAKCLCDGTGYAGTHCQFSQYSPSCQSLIEKGHHASGPYMIDIDGNGRIPPVQVYCKMENTSGMKKGVTVFQHSVPKGLWVRKQSYGGKIVSVPVEYFEMTREMLKMFTLR